VSLGPRFSNEAVNGDLLDLIEGGNPAISGGRSGLLRERVADVGRHIEREGGPALEPELGGLDVLEEVAGNFIAEVAGGDEVESAAENQHDQNGRGEDEALEAGVGAGEVAAAGEVVEPENGGGGCDQKSAVENPDEGGARFRAAGRKLEAVREGGEIQHRFGGWRIFGRGAFPSEIWAKSEWNYIGGCGKCTCNFRLFYSDFI